MEWIIVGLIVVSSSMVVCLGGVYYRLFFYLPVPDTSPKKSLLPAAAVDSEPEVVFDSIYRQKI
jgi:hypothetical protein